LPRGPAAAAAHNRSRVRERVRAAPARDAGPDLGRILTKEPPMPTLPADFADLEPFADWAIPTERARYAKRLASTMDELQVFYDVAFPRLEAATAYLQNVELDGIAEDDKRL